MSATTARLLVTATELARRLGVRRRTVYRWRKRGAPYVPVVGARGPVFDLSAVERWRNGPR